MKKMTLPLVMIASLATLVSCGTETNLGITTPVKNPTVSGVVVTPVVNTGIVTTTSSGNTATPVVLTRKETVSYGTPSADAPVEFNVTVTDGIITAASSTTLATEEASKYNQDAFAKEVSVKVVGKKAKDLKVDAIGGASLTTLAFEKFVHSF